MRDLKRRVVWAAAGAAVLVWVTPGRAASSFDPGFETGTLGGWTAKGDVQVVQSHDSLDAYLQAAPPYHAATFDPTQGQWMAALSNNADAGALDASTLGIGEFPGRPVTVGSTIAATFDALAGQSIAFDWLFDPDTSYGDPQTDQDFAFVTISDGFAQVLADVYGGVGASYQWQTFSHTFDAQGAYTVTIGVLEADDTRSDPPGFDFDDAVHSALLIDGIPSTSAAQTPTATVIPTPTAALAGFAGLVLMAVRRRRRA